MEYPRWALDANPLGLLFRAAYADFRALLAREPKRTGEPVSMEVADSAARRMTASLRDIRVMLARRAGARVTMGDVDQTEALQYAFAVVVDETLLNEAWQGKDAWTEHLLEAAIFKTRSGGQRLIERIDAVTRNNDRPSREIAEVYLHCLMLGFAGHLRDRANAPAALAQKRATLFAYLYPDLPTIDESAFVLTESRDDNVIRTEPRKRSLAAQMRLYLFAGALVAVPLIASIIMWLYLRPVVGDVVRELQVAA